MILNSKQSKTFNINSDELSLLRYRATAITKTGFG